MPKGLRRFHGGGDRHFITCSCYHRKRFLGSARRRDLFLAILEQVRRRYDFVIWGYVAMPEHFQHLHDQREVSLLGSVTSRWKRKKQRLASEEEWGTRVYREG